MDQGQGGKVHPYFGSYSSLVEEQIDELTWWTSNKINGMSMLKDIS